MAGASLEQLSLLEQLHDRVETVAHLGIPRLLEHAPKQGCPSRIARRQQVSEPQECLFKIAKLLRHLLLPGGETTALRGFLGHRRGDGLVRGLHRSADHGQETDRRQKRGRGGRSGDVSHGRSNASLARRFC